MSLEHNFDAVFAATLAIREKQIQQSYRPVIGIHKWFARRPGSLFRSLLLAEFNGSEPLEASYWRAHRHEGVIADPFMGGGTTVFEANRLGFSVVAADINPMAYWIVRQSLSPIDLGLFASTAETVAAAVSAEVGELYRTECLKCGKTADAKYFLWVKTELCPYCNTANDLFPGYLLAEAVRHPNHVLLCAICGALNEFEKQPTRKSPNKCGDCGSLVYVEGPARRQHIPCCKCKREFRYPQPSSTKSPPNHRMWALEYYCPFCKPTHTGRFFKKPSKDDITRFAQARELLAQTTGLPIPTDEIPDGDETRRLHRWGYRSYRDMFNDRQLLGLGALLRRISKVPHHEIRHALLTVFSDFLRYQNLLCRYDTYALKCQDIFSVHGFPVGLVQCENNLLGIQRVGSGSFRHFVEKYQRSKRFCEAPFETQIQGKKKRIVAIPGEQIAARLVDTFPKADEREAWLLRAEATCADLPPRSIDGVFTDPPYFANVQYAELMDFCYAWLRLGLRNEFAEFKPLTTRTFQELTGNVTLGRGLEQFTAGLSAVFCHYVAALKPGAPFVFTYHHNDPAAYIPIIVAVLDAGMNCTVTFPAAAEMSASLHIAGTLSSVLDSVFVCRIGAPQLPSGDMEKLMLSDIESMRKSSVRVSEGDVRCLAAGHVAREVINQLLSTWQVDEPLAKRMAQARERLANVAGLLDVESLATAVKHGRQRKMVNGTQALASTV